MNLPVFSGDAGIRDVVTLMREPSYLRLAGKCLAGGAGVAVVARRLPPQLAMPLALTAGIYIGLEMAAWMEEQAKKNRGPILDATAETGPAIAEEATE